MGIAQLSFLSNTLGFHTNVYVILPTEPKPDQNYQTHYAEMKPLKTLYLLHGGGGNGQDWLRYTSIERYAEEHQVAVVLPEVSGSCFYADMAHGYDYFSYLTEELPQVLTAHFPLANKREDRMVAGFSMGGYGAFKWALRRPDFFAYAGNFGGASLIVNLFETMRNDNFQNTQQEQVIHCAWENLENLRGSDSDSAYLLSEIAKHPKDCPNLFVGVGKEDFGYPLTQEYLKTANELWIPIHYYEMDGGHSWAVCDQLIQVFLSFALKQEKQQ